MKQENTHKTWQRYLTFLLIHLILPISGQLSASLLYDQIPHDPFSRSEEICPLEDHSTLDDDDDIDHLVK